jgi:hypothetical protein
MATMLLALPALAADETTVKPTALVFAHYGLDLTEGSENASEFDIDRAYLGAVGSVGEHWGAKVLFDASREFEGVNDKTFVFLKHAWMEYHRGDLKVRGGMVDTGFVPYGEQFTGFRYVTKQLADDNKVLSSADLGANVQGKAAGGLLDWHAGVYNGEGYSHAEVSGSGGKSFEARVAVDPLAPKKGKTSLAIVGYGRYATGDSELAGGAGEEPSQLVYAGGLGYKMPHFVGWAEYVGVSQDEVSGGGFSATLSPRMPKYGALLVRYDKFNADNDVEDGGYSKLIAGVSHDFVEKFSLAATYETVTLDATPDDPTSGVFVRMQAGF